MFLPGEFPWILKSIAVTDDINKMKDKNLMITSIDAGKAFNKVQYVFMIYILKKKPRHRVNVEGP